MKHSCREEFDVIRIDNAIGATPRISASEASSSPGLCRQRGRDWLLASARTRLAQEYSNCGASADQHALRKFQEISFE
jgi:hypothetical protein